MNIFIWFYNIGYINQKDNIPKYAYNNTYGNKQLKGKLQCGSGVNDPKYCKYGEGGGVIEIVTTGTVTIEEYVASESFFGTGGTIFICCKKLINKGKLKATAVRNETGDGRIAIYTDEYDNKDGGIIKPEPYWGTYK